MSQSSEYSPLQCRWKWCRNTYPTVVDLLEHVREHVRQTEPVYFRDLALHRRAEDGFGSSLSVITMGSGSDQSVAQNSIDPVPDACSLSLPSLFLPAAAAASPIPQAPLPVMDFSLLLDSPSRPLKRQKIMSPGIDLSLSHSRSNSTQTPPPRGLNRTPGFASLASASESSQAIPNPEVPDLDTLISQTLAGASSQNHFASPNGTVPHGSQSFSGSDGSVERHLTQDFDTTFEGAVPNFNDVLRANGLGDSQNLYAGELNWDDEPIPNLPRSQSHTPSWSPQSQSQSQQQSSLMGTSPPSGESRELPLQRRQSWYQSPRRVSNPKTIPFGASPTPGSAGQGGPIPNTITSQPQPRISTLTPVKTYLSGSLKISSPGLHSQPYGDAINPHILHQPQYSDLASQSPSQNASFVIQTQAPYRSPSMSQ